MSSDDKPEQRPRAPAPAGKEKEKADQSTPSLDELDLAWGGTGDFDDEATMVAKVPHDLVALSRRGSEMQRVATKVEEPEKHEAITARPPPMEASVVVDVAIPHEKLPPVSVSDGSAEAAEETEEGEDEEEEEELAADDLDAGWDIEEERAAAADVAAGLDPEARRKAAEARAAARKEKSRAKALAAKEKRKARAEAIRQKQKKPKKRSVPPPRDASARATASSRPPAARPAAGKPISVPPPPAGEGRDADTGTALRTVAPRGAQRDVLRMVLFVAVVVVLGALTIGLMRR